MDFGDDTPFSGYQGLVRLRSIGVESDRWLRALCRLHGDQRSSLAMAREVEFTGISLQGNPGAIANEPVKIKLFFDPDDETGTRYAEAYLNIDLARQRVEFNEKDPEYRDPLLRALGVRRRARQGRAR